MKTFQIASLLETPMMPRFILQCFKPQGPCQEKQITVPPAHASQGDAFIFSFFFYLPQQTTIVMVLIPWLLGVHVCVCVCVWQWAACDAFTVSHYFCACDVSNRNSFSLFFFLFTHTPRVHTRTDTHTHKEDLTQSKCPDRPSQLDTREQWCFPLALMAWGIFSLTDSIHSPHRTLTSSTFPRSLSLYPSLSSLISHSRAPHPVFLSFCIHRIALTWDLWS